MTADTERRLAKWIDGGRHRSVRVDYHDGAYGGYRWAVLGWDRMAQEVIVSMQHGRTLNAAMRRFLREAKTN